MPLAADFIDKRCAAYPLGLMSPFHLAVICIGGATILLFVFVALRSALRGGEANKDSQQGETRMHKWSRWLVVRQPWFFPCFLAAFIACVIASTVYYSGKFLPSPPAAPGADIVPLFNTTVIITGVAFLITQVLLFYFPFRFRARAHTRARFISGNMKLELVWTLIPAVTFVFLFLWGQKLWSKMIAAPPTDALLIEVVAEQFNWKARYPGADGTLGRSAFRYVTEANRMGVDPDDPAHGDDFVPVQMHIPKNRTIELRLWSKDVIHSFFIPIFRVKMDALPGMVTTTHFTATATTAEMREKLNDPDFNYEIACAELCGRMHFAMKLILVVDEPEAFEAWYASQEPLGVKDSEMLADGS